MKKKVFFLLLFIVVSFLLQKMISEKETIHSSGYENRIQVELVRVVDGDTIVVNHEGREERVRLVGIDAPESTTEHVQPECFGYEAKDFLSKLLINENHIYLEFDEVVGMRDRYGRLLVYIFLLSGEHINTELISAGYAKEYTYQQQNYRYKDIYKEAEDQAQENNRGIWNESYCLAN